MGPHRSPLTHPVTWAVVAAVVVLVGWAVLRTMGKDAGTSWSSVSLSGEADFHSLVVADQQVFGWDSGTGQLMVSADRATWETRSTLDLLSFAADPADLDYLIAAAPAELIASTDGGRSWDLRYRDPEQER